MIVYRNFCKRYGRHTAVDGLDLTVSRGETVAFIGPNGSGKSTTLKAALGLVRPTSGEVRIAGIDVCRDGRAARAKVGYLPQRLTFSDGTTARQVMDFYARLRGAPKSVVDPLLDRVGLLDAAGRITDGFSGGMLQRLGIAVALLGEPEILILDEPTAALDPTGALAVRDIVADIRSEGTTVLISSHDLAEVEALADRIAVFVQGELAALGTIPELAKQYGITGAGMEDIYRAATGESANTTRPLRGVA